MPETEIIITVEGEPEEVPARAFIDAARNSLTILRDLDATISHKSQGTIRWVIGRLHKGSPAEISYRAISTPNITDVSAEVAKNYLEGLEMLAEGKRLPSVFSERALEAAKNLARVRGRPGVKLIRMRNNGRSIVVSEKIAGNIDDLLQRTFQAFGSIEGKLESVTVHDQRTFRVYDFIYDRGIQCFFNPEIFKKTEKAIRIDDLPIRVIVTGKIRTDQFGKPEAMRVSELRVLPSETDLPTPAQMRGIAKGMTEGQLAEDYLRKIREGE